MEAFLIIFGILICFIGIMAALCDFDSFFMGVIIAVLGAFVFRGGLEVGDLNGQIQTQQQTIVQLKKVHKDKLETLNKSFMESQEAAMELAIENQALHAKQNECVEKQQVADETLNGIIEILKDETR